MVIVILLDGCELNKTCRTMHSYEVIMYLIIFIKVLRNFLELFID